VLVSQIAHGFTNPWEENRMGGPPPKRTRRRSATPQRGEWKAPPGCGWQHGPIPTIPDEVVTDASKWAWDVWMHAWFAAFWKPEALPGLRQVILAYEECEVYPGSRARAELRQLMDMYGITPKGQQDRRWSPPVEEEPEQEAPQRHRYDKIAAVA